MCFLKQSQRRRFRRLKRKWSTNQLHPSPQCNPRSSLAASFTAVSTLLSTLAAHPSTKPCLIRIIAARLNDCSVRLVQSRDFTATSRNFWHSTAPGFILRREENPGLFVFSLVGNITVSSLCFDAWLENKIGGLVELPWEITAFARRRFYSLPHLGCFFN